MSAASQPHSCIPTISAFPSFGQAVFPSHQGHFLTCACDTVTKLTSRISQPGRCDGQVDHGLQGWRQDPGRPARARCAMPDIEKASGCIQEGAPAKADCTIIMSEEDFVKMMKGAVSSQSLFLKDELSCAEYLDCWIPRSLADFTRASPAPLKLVVLAGQDESEGRSAARNEAWGGTEAGTESQALIPIRWLEQQSVGSGARRKKGRRSCDKDSEQSRQSGWKWSERGRQP
eukprot:2564138-Rhodomonas_salina.1